MIAVAFSGCTKANDDNNNDDVAANQEEAYVVTLYFANEEYIQSGDESMDKMLSYQDEVIADEDSVYIDTLEKLRELPNTQCSSSINDKIQFIDVTLEEGTGYVDLASEGLNGGSLEEMFLVSQIVDTLIGSFDQISQVVFLVDGEPAETLMGHVDTLEPFTEDLF